MWLCCNAGGVLLCVGFCGSCGCGCGLLWMIAFERWVGVTIVLVVCGDLRFVG